MTGRKRTLAAWRQQQRPWTEEEKAAEYVRARQREFMLDVVSTLLPYRDQYGQEPNLAHATDDGEMDAKAAIRPLIWPEHVGQVA
jgi:hypothetical protein